MKKFFAVSAIFISSYLIFIVATMPLAFVINTIELPRNIDIESVSGSIWEGEIALISVDHNDVNNIKTNLSFWSLFILSPTVDISFGDALSAGPEGKFTLAASLSKLTFSDVELFISANDIAKKLPLPIPATAQGNAELTLDEISFNIADKLSCESAQGQASWQRAVVTALDNTVKLGNISAKIACEKGDLTAAILPDNNLGLTFDARLNLAKQKPSGQGYLKPGAKFPAELKPALSFLGRVDNKGRYSLKF